VLTLPPRAFTPAPKVSSSLVEFVPLADPEPAGSTDALQKIVAAAFGQRRKMLRQSLKTLMQDPEILLNSANIESTLRAEVLTVSDFCRMARLWNDNNADRT
jgi:16S rRNA (adenine1518-N6/adenine1519-N6)-dimethyltransferase